LPFAGGVLPGLLSSCDKGFEEINTNPNAVSVPTPQYIFSKALYDGAANSGNTGKLLFGAMQYTTSYNDVEGFGSKYVASQVNAVFFLISAWLIPTRSMRSGK
jgi:hypothetical protein